MLPSIELHRIAAMLAIRMFTASLAACLKKDIGREFGKMTVESVFEDFIEFPALVKAKGDRIVVTFYGNYKEKHKAAVEELMRGFDEAGRNVSIPWLGNRRIEVRFK